MKHFVYICIVKNDNKIVNKIVSKYKHKFSKNESKMKKYNVGIKLKSGSGYSTSVEALNETEAQIKAMNKAYKNGFNVGPWFETPIIYTIER